MAVYEMTGTPCAELCNELALVAQHIGLKKYGISVSRSPGIYVGYLRWRDDHILEDDNWVAMSLCLLDQDFRTNEDFSNWKYDAKWRIDKMIREIKEKQGGIGLQS